MISFENISFSVAGRTLVKNSTVSIPSGHKVGLVGKNGTGKTSLFRLLYGEITLDQGNLKLNKNTRIGGVSQEVSGSSVTLLDTVLAADRERNDLLQKAEEEKNPLKIRTYNLKKLTSHICTGKKQEKSASKELRAEKAAKNAYFQKINFDD